MSDYGAVQQPAHRSEQVELAPVATQQGFGASHFRRINDLPKLFYRIARSCQYVLLPRRKSPDNFTGPLNAPGDHAGSAEVV